MGVSASVAMVLCASIVGVSDVVRSNVIIWWMKCELDDDDVPRDHCTF